MKGVDVNPEILRWARETAGLGLAEAVRKLQLKSARGVDAVDRLEALEAGRQAPTRAMLSKMARVYRRPLVVFYLDRPPKRADRGEDYRTDSSERSARDEARLDALIREVRARQGILKSAMLVQDDVEPVAFVGSASVNDGVQRVLASVQATLDLSLAQFRNAPAPEQAFRLLRGQAERAGVFVLLQGDLGSHHTRIGADVFRGIALSDTIAPFVVLNPNDHRRAWAFTLLHELTHLWLGETSVSGGFPPARTVEKFCNDVASRYLLPSDDLQQIDPPSGRSITTLASALRGYAMDRNVSTSMMAYRLHRCGKIDRPTWQGLVAHWQGLQDRERGTPVEQSGVPTYYAIRRHRLGSRLLQLTNQLMATGDLTTIKAAQVLNVNPHLIHRISNVVSS